MPTLLAVCFGADRACAALAQQPGLGSELLSYARMAALASTDAAAAHDDTDAKRDAQAGAGSCNDAQCACGSAALDTGQALPLPPLGRFCLAARFPLELLPEAVAYLERQLQI